MKGVILAGGKGTRMGLLTKVVNKHLLPVYDRPMIMYPLRTLISLGLKSIMIVTDKGRAGEFVNFLGTGREFGVRFTYGLQDKAEGIADAISIARDFANDDDITVILGDNIFLGKIALGTLVKNKAKIFIKRVKDPERFGVAEIIDGKLQGIVEKPKNNISNFAITGLYQYPSDVFDIIDTLEPSERNELEVTELNRAFLKQNRLSFEILDSYWIDAGTVESLFEAQYAARDHVLTESINVDNNLRS